MHVVFEQKQELVPGIWEFYFKPERPLDYIPGQYVDLRLPHEHADNRGASRTFSLTSLPDEPFISFAVKIETPCSTYKQVLRALQPGDTATITDAMGDVVLPKDPRVPLVFVAGGLGIASFVSSTRWLTKHKERRPITLLYAVRNEGDILFEDIFNAYQFPIKRTLFTPGQRPVRISAALIAEQLVPDSLLYISGSERFVEGLRQELQRDFGVPNEKIIYDFFDGYSEL